ncbi:COMM domain-containing protein 5 [Nymphon striatum]|nr:COMM domain-containing protein 5 [Nymphon striatum]
MLQPCNPRIFLQNSVLAEPSIPADFANDLASVVYGSKRKDIDAHSKATSPSVPSLDQVRWRVDVTISTSHLNRVLEPCVLMELNLTDGSKHTFEVPVTKFHKLRHDVAQLLREMEDLEKRSIFKIQDK